MAMFTVQLKPLSELFLKVETRPLESFQLRVSCIDPGLVKPNLVKFCFRGDTERAKTSLSGWLL